MQNDRLIYRASSTVLCARAYFLQKVRITFNISRETSLAIDFIHSSEYYLHYILLSDLRELRLVMAPHSTCDVDTISEVTGLIVIRHMPLLDLQIISHCSSGSKSK